MDASTNKGHVENELFVILRCKRDDVIVEVTTHARYFCVLEPTKGDADGLVQCLGTALKTMGIDKMFRREDVLGAHEHPVLVGCGIHKYICSKQHARKAEGCLTVVEFWAWCYAHRLELACKDSFTSHLFLDIDDMLLRLYYLYK